MGWVTLTLRKRELKYSHAEYQMRDLQISREKRQLARTKQAETARIQNEQVHALSPLKTDYNNDKQRIRDQINALREEQKNSKDENGKITIDHSSDISALQLELSDAQTEYTEEVNNEKTFYETELAMIEEEVNDEEVQLDLEQSDVEAQMEAISQELQAVSEAVSTEIQNSTIKLA